MPSCARVYNHAIFFVCLPGAFINTDCESCVLCGNKAVWLQGASLGFGIE